MIVGVVFGPNAASAPVFVWAQISVLLIHLLMHLGSNSRSVLASPVWNRAVVEQYVGPRVRAELDDSNTHYIHHPAASDLQQQQTLQFNQNDIWSLEIPAKMAVFIIINGRLDIPHVVYLQETTANDMSSHVA